jgi:hypothetical protein
LYNLSNRITVLLMGISVSQLIGCADVVEPGPMGAHSATIGDCAAGWQQEQGPLGALSCELGLSIRAAEPALKDELRQALGSYAQALQRGDAAAVEKLISTEMRARIDERGPGTDFRASLQSFVASEQRKLARSVGSLKPSRTSLTVTSADMLADGSIAAIEVAVDGKPLPKPFYFTQEDSGYKLNIVQPDIGLASTSYQVKNDDLVNRSFSCSGGASAVVAPTQQMQVACEDSCSGFFDGTTFTASAGSATCDYNTWGVDMYIRSGFPVCNDPC